MGLLESLAIGVGETGAKMGEEYVKEQAAATEFANRMSAFRQQLEMTQKAKDAERIDRTAAIEKEAGLNAASRKTVPAEVGAYSDDIAKTINSAFDSGQITDDVRQSGLLAATKYANDNAISDGKVTSKDRLNASVKLGYTDPEKATKTDYDEERNKVSDKRNELLDGVNNRREDRLQALAELQTKHIIGAEGRASEKEARDNAREQRAATSKALDGVNAEIKNLEKESANPLLDANVKVVIDRQMMDLRNEAKGYRARLDSAGIKPAEAKAESTIDFTRGADGKLTSKKPGATVAAIPSQPGNVETNAHRQEEADKSGPRKQSVEISQEEVSQIKDRRLLSQEARLKASAEKMAEQMARDIQREEFNRRLSGGK